MAPVTLVIALLVAFQVKHFVADYPLQTRWMLGKFKDWPDFVVPLTAHALVHAVGTFLIACWLVPLPHAAALAGFDATLHFAMDRIKADRKLLGRFKPLTAETAPTATTDQWASNDYFWYALGLDQGVHHLTHYAVIAWILLHRS